MNLPAAPLATSRITVMQGQSQVSADPAVELSTVLGSCVAACLYDPVAKLGGMNHFLLAEPAASQSPGRVDEHYGVYLMEVLINAMLAKGAIKSRLRAHLYGGANIRLGMMPIGTANAEFARTFLSREGIPLAREDLGGSNARRVDFLPAHGKARCRLVEKALVADPPTPPRPPRASGDVELF